MAKKKKVEVQKEVNLDEMFGPFVIPQIDEVPVGLRTYKPAFSRTKPVSPMRGTQVEDKIVIPENDMHEDIDAAYDQYRVNRKLTKEDEIKKYGVAHHEFSSVDQGDDNNYVDNEVKEESFGQDIDTIEELEIPESVQEEPEEPSYDEFAGYEPVEPIYDEPVMEPQDDTYIEDIKEDVPTPTVQEPSKPFVFSRNEELPEYMEKPESKEKEEDTIVPEELVNYNETSMVFEEPEKESSIPSIEDSRNVLHEDRYFSYQYPPISLLNPVDMNQDFNQEEINRNIEIIDKVLADFDINGHVDNTILGPTITRYEVSIAGGIKLSRVEQIEDNIKMELHAISLVVQAPIPGKGKVGIDVPNQHPRTVHLSEIVSKENFMNTDKPLLFAVGLDTDNKPVYADIATMPHLLIAGGTGSGKSSCLNSLLTSIIMHNSPDDLRLILIDPKRVEFNKYRDIPHLVTPIVKEPNLAFEALKWAEKEMDDRYRLLDEYFASDIYEYNKMVGKNPEIKHMPRLLIVIDEFGNLMDEGGPEFVATVKNLASKGRASGVNMVVATQRPSTDVITGTIKTNIQARIALKTASAVDSMTILDHGGAEKLLGNGDLWLKLIDQPIRVQGSFITPEEIIRVTDYIRSNYRPDYLFTHEQLETAMRNNFFGTESEEDPKFLETVAYYTTTLTMCSIQKVIDKFNIGFPRAQKIIKRLSELGILEEVEGKQPRKVLKTYEQVKEIFGRK